MSRAPVVALLLAGACAPRPAPSRAPAPAAAPVAAPAGARAFVIERAADLLGGPEADGQVGDVRLDNGLVAFVVDRADSALGFADSGGDLLDAAPLDAGTPRDALKQIFGYLDDFFPRQPLHDRIELVPPGPDGAAVVRAHGRDSDDPRLVATTEYRLRPGRRALELVTTIENRGPVPVKSYEIGDAIQWGRIERMLPGAGTGRHDVVHVADGFVWGLSEGAAYAYVTPSARMHREPPPAGQPPPPDTALVGRVGTMWSDFNIMTVDLPPGGRVDVHRYLVVGPPDGEAVLAEVGRLRFQEWRPLPVRVVDEAGAPLGGARVVVDDGVSGRQRVVVRTRADGAVGIPLPPGRWRLRPDGLGRTGTAVEVDVGAGVLAPVTLPMSAPGRLVFEVEEGGTPSPARLTLVGEGTTRTPHLGPVFDTPAANLVLTVDGRGEVRLPPGRYRAIASRGPEFTLDEQVLDVRPAVDEPTRARFHLQRAVDLGGYVCADFHQHASPSPDSGTTMTARAASNLAEGFSVMVPTDHNVLADWTPALARLGATRPLALVLGEEATRDGIGHFNAWPLLFHAGALRGGALDVRTLDAHAMVAGLRAADGNADKVVQVNHPRADIIGYFQTIHYDPTAPSLPPNWEGGFDAIEVMGSKNPALLDLPLRDWLSLLRRGLVYTAVGGSDSHGIAGQEVGIPRTCVAVPAGTAPERLGAALVDGVRRRRDAFVTTGPVVRAHIGNVGMGGLARAPGGKAALAIEVQAAPWIDVRTVQVLVDGDPVGPPIAVPPSTARVRLQRTVPLALRADAFVVVVVRGEKSMEPVYSRRHDDPPPLPVAFTNPIFVDVDGDGVWRSRGAR